MNSHASQAAADLVFQGGAAQHRFELSAIRIALGRAELALIRGNAAEARAAIDELERAAATTPAVTRESPIAVLSLAVRVSNRLEQSGVATVGDLCQRSRSELYAIPGFGSGYVREIVLALERYGFALTERTIAGRKS